MAMPFVSLQYCDHNAGVEWSERSARRVKERS
jgi:hypothetical protein